MPTDQKVTGLSPVGVTEEREPQKVLFLAFIPLPSEIRRQLPACGKNTAGAPYPHLSHERHGRQSRKAAAQVETAPKTAHGIVRFGSGALRHRNMPCRTQRTGATQIRSCRPPGHRPEAHPGTKNQYTANQYIFNIPYNKGRRTIAGQTESSK